MIVNGKEAGTSLPTVFEFGANKLRTAIINDSHWFHAQDVCNVLGITNARDVVSRTLDDDEKLMSEFPTSGSGTKRAWVINESGLWALVLRSNKPNAKAFRKWVTAEVLPQLRETGEYSTKSANGIEADGTHNEGQVYHVVVGRHSIAVTYFQGRMWAGITLLTRMMGYDSGMNALQAINWTGEGHVRQFDYRTGSIWMVDAEGLRRIMSRSRYSMSATDAADVFRTVYRETASGHALPEGFAYSFTAEQMNEVFTAVGVPPFNRGEVMRLISLGKI